MTTTDYTTALLVDQTPKEVYDAINNISGWWTENLEGGTTKLNNVFTVRFGETWITLKIVELVPGKKIVWHITDCYKHWLKDKKEWKGTTIHWDMATKGDKTQIAFLHIGLVPVLECYKGCEKAWDQYINGSLHKLITKGKGKPELK